MRKFINDEAGFVVSAELVLIVTLIFTAVAVGMAVARDSLVSEYNDLSEMFGVIDQTFHVQGMEVGNGLPAPHPYHGNAHGFGYNDESDVCDCEPITYVSVCGKNDPSGTGVDEGTP